MTGYKVESTDSGVGKVDQHSDDIDSSHLVTGVWIFGKHVLLPAGTIQRVGQQAEDYIALTQNEIKDSPEFDNVGDAGHHEQVGSYYQNPRSI
ncbi:PRC-barrel domain containing protein [Streptomyces sp. BF23-18]|uniref:PRC-barrel domain containing protein n=1 Tax=Streptomyces sp. BF23-18 TaxID=3240282 RepID=UPI0034E40090